MSTAQSIITSSSDGPTLELAISVWLDAKSRKSDSIRTHEAYERGLTDFRRMLRRADLDLDSDARAVGLAAQAWAFRAADGVSGVAGATANQRLAIVSSFYTFGAKRWLLLDAEGKPLPNPINQIERARVQAYAGARALADETVQGCLAAIDRSTLLGLRDYALLVLAFQTGRRANELRILRCGDLVQEAGALTVTWTRTKGGKVMHDTLPNTTRDVLVAWLHAFYGAMALGINDEPVFPSVSRRNYGQQMTYHGISQIYKRRLSTGKVHTSRHSFARSMEDAGAKVSTIQARLGHSDLSTTGRYLAELSSGGNPYAEEIARRMGLGSEAK